MDLYQNYVAFWPLTASLVSNITSKKIPFHAENPARDPPENTVINVSLKVSGFRIQNNFC